MKSLHGKVYQMFEKGKYKEIVTMLEGRRLNDDLYNELGSSYLKLGDKDKAKLYYERALEFNPNNDGSLTSIGTVLFHQGKVDDAIKYYEMAIKVNPNNSDPYKNLATIAVKQKNYQEAYKQIMRYLSIDPEDKIFLGYKSRIEPLLTKTD